MSEHIIRQRTGLNVPIGGCASPEVLELVGNTPLIRVDIPDIPPQVNILVKVESRNPGGSIKDRAALQIFWDAIESGKLSGNKSLLDSTSGNTGIAYAMIGAIMGRRVTLCVPANASPAKLSLMEVMGAEIVYTDPVEGSDGSERVAKEIFERNPEKYFYADQYSNPSNPKAHFNNTGPEIWHQTRGTITHIVAGIGTSGTIMGLSRYFRCKSGGIRVVGIQPSSPMHGLEGLKHLKTAAVPVIFREDALDEKRYVDTADAKRWVDKLAVEKGLLVGPSGGAALSGAVDLAKTLDFGTIVAILPDSGERYLPFRTAKTYESFVSHDDVGHHYERI